jgi:flagellar hook-associated protein 1 FlgK
MNLSVALSSAQSALSATATQTSIISRNITGAADPGYSRKLGMTTTLGMGGVKLVSVARAADTALFMRMLVATSAASSHEALLKGLNELERTIEDPELNHSVAASIGKVTNAVQMLAETPSDPVLAASLLAASYDLAGSLNAATGVVQGVRQNADAAMAESVDRINTILAQFETVNRAVIVGTQAGTDVTDSLDARDRLLSRLSEEVGISVITRPNNDVAIYTDSGVTLFEKSARTISFDRTYTYAPNTTGAAVFADGVPLTGPAATMGIKSGALFGNAMVRDQVAVTYQLQLDEIARGLITAFAESDQSDPPALPDAPGLFTYPGAPAMLPPGVASTGLAGLISVTAAADPARGGDLNRLRDGGLAGGAYVYNAGGDAAFSDRLQGLLASLGAQQSFDPQSQTNPNSTLSRFASSSVSWLESARQAAGIEANQRTTFLERTSDALSNLTGVNLDEELALMMELERSYGASARIITAVDNMLQMLLQATR